MGRISSNLVHNLGPEHIFKIRKQGEGVFDAYGWADNLSSLSRGRGGGATVPDWETMVGGISGWSFPPTVMNDLEVSWHINHDWAVGTDQYPHIHFCAKDDQVEGVCRWGIEYTLAKREQGVFGDTVTVYLEATIPANNALEHTVIEVSDADAISGDLLEVDALVLARVFRDGAHANDTYAGDVFGLFLDLHYQRNKYATLNKAFPYNG